MPIVTDLVFSVLLLICLFQVKHMFADFYLQTPKMLTGRDEYMHMGRAQHAAVHMVMSIPCLWIIGTGWGVLIALVVAEWIVHYHIDFWKGWHSSKKGFTPADPGFWRAVGFDQALHQLTYVTMGAIWVATL